MKAYLLDVQRAADHGLESIVGDVSFGDVQFGFSQIADARSEAEAEQVHQGEDMIGKAGRIGVVLLDAQVGLVIEQTVEHIGRVAKTDVVIPILVECFC